MAAASGRLLPGALQATGWGTQETSAAKVHVCTLLMKQRASWNHEQKQRLHHMLGRHGVVAKQAGELHNTLRWLHCSCEPEPLHQDACFGRQRPVTLKSLPVLLSQIVVDCGECLGLGHGSSRAMVGSLCHGCINAIANQLFHVFWQRSLPHLGEQGCCILGCQWLHCFNLLHAVFHQGFLFLHTGMLWSLPSAQEKAGNTSYFISNIIDIPHGFARWKPSFPLVSQHFVKSLWANTKEYTNNTHQQAWPHDIQGKQSICKATPTKLQPRGKLTEHMWLHCTQHHPKHCLLPALWKLV